MPFEQTHIPELGPREANQARADIATLWGRDGRYLNQLTPAERGAFDRLMAQGLALLEPQSRLDQDLGYGKIRVNEEALVRINPPESLQDPDGHEEAVG